MCRFAAPTLVAMARAVPPPPHRLRESLSSAKGSLPRESASSFYPCLSLVFRSSLVCRCGTAVFARCTIARLRTLILEVLDQFVFLEETVAALIDRIELLHHAFWCLGARDLAILVRVPLIEHVIGAFFRCLLARANLI